MLDWQGNIVEKQQRTKILVESIEEDQVMSAALYVGAAEAKLVNERYETVVNKLENPVLPYIPRAADQIASVFADIDPNLQDDVLYSRMNEMVTLSHFKMTIGAITMSKKGNYMLADDQSVATDSDDDDSDDESLSLSNELDIDEYFVSATTADKT